MGKEEQIQHWVKTAELDWTTAERSFETKTIFACSVLFSFGIGKTFESPLVKG